MASSSNKRPQKNSNFLHPAQVPLSFLLKKKKLSKKAKETFVRSISKLKSQDSKPPIKELERNHRRNSFVVKNMGRFFKPRAKHASLPSVGSIASNDENSETSSVHDQNKSIGTTETEDSPISTRPKIDGRDWSDLGSPWSASLGSDCVSPAGGKEEAGHDTENLETSKNRKIPQCNCVAIGLPEYEIGFLRKKTLVSFPHFSSIESYPVGSIGRGTSSNGESGMRFQCMPSPPKKLPTRELKNTVRRAMQQLKKIMKVQGSKGGGNELWRKRILMGRRCRPLDFSGVIENDEKGNRRAGNVIPRCRRESLTITYDGDRVCQLLEIFY